MSLVHIAFDGRYIRTDYHDGISRFSANLVSELAELVKDRSNIRLTVLLSHPSQRKQIPFSGQLETCLVSNPTSVREVLVARQVNKLRPSVVFSPMQTMGTWGRRYRVVLTIHDLIYYSHRTPPQQFNPLVRVLWRVYHLAWWPQRLLLSGADAVVTVSETTRQLIYRHRLAQCPVYVVPNAAMTNGPDEPAPLADRKPTCVYMGSFMPYKNVETLVRAFALLPEVELRLLSRISVAQRRRLSDLAPTAKLVFLNGCSDEEYDQELRSATALVSASKDEGFGIPLVESMSAGTPVVVSDIEIFREIGGDAALYAPADSPEKFAACIRELLDARTWKERSAAVLARSETFSWTKSATRLLDVLIEVADAKSSSEVAEHF